MAPSAFLLGLAVTMAIAAIGRAADQQASLSRRSLLNHVHNVKFQGHKYPESMYGDGDTPDSDCSQFPDQNYSWIAALNLGCKPKGGHDPIKLHKGGKVPGCNGDFPDDCPKEYDGKFDTCLSIVSGAVAGDNEELFADDGTWLTWNQKHGSCYIYTNTECHKLSDEDPQDNSFQYCGFT